MRALLRAAGDPHRAIPAILIAGTNGKGSVAATLDAIAGAAGLKAGLYTSPHLVQINERWRIAGDDISDRALRRAIDRLRSVSESASIRPTYFEALTLIAFIAFADAGCELNILEVGMGGRLDATNVVRPVLSLITSVGLDHQEFLGNTTRAIAREKAGIIHRGTVALTAVTDPSVLTVIRRRCDLLDVSLHVMSEETFANPVGDGVLVRTPSSQYALTPRLAGAHQLDNLALAVRAAEELAQRFPIDAAAIVRGVGSVRWSGRLETFNLGSTRVIVDGAHNPDGAGVLAQYLLHSDAGPVELVFAAMKDKRWEEMLQVLAPHCSAVHITRADVERGENPLGIRELASRLGLASSVHLDPVEALRHALEVAVSRVVVVAGSLYLAGAVLPELRRLADPTTAH